MPKNQAREEAIALRKTGKSYSQILEIVPVSKSTLSRWLFAYPLGKDRLVILRDRNKKRIKNFQRTMQKKREARLSSIYSERKMTLLPLRKRELLLSGLLLYLGEGKKGLNQVISVSNSDPRVIKFALYWFTTALEIPREKILVYLHIYSDMDENKEINFWNKILNLPKKNFRKPYIKKSTLSAINHKGYGHGTCNLTVGNVRLKESIELSIKAILDFVDKRV